MCGFQLYTKLSFYDECLISRNCYPKFLHYLIHTASIKVVLIYAKSTLRSRNKKANSPFKAPCTNNIHKYIWMYPSMAVECIRFKVKLLKI